MTSVSGVTFAGSSLQGVQPTFLDAFAQAARAVGATMVNVISGYRTPQQNAAAGGVGGSYHLQGLALDATLYIPGRGWVPAGTALQGVAGNYGLRSGDQPGFFNGQPDPNHVDAGGGLASGGYTSSGVPATTSSTVLPVGCSGVITLFGALSLCAFELARWLA